MGHGRGKSYSSPETPPVFPIINRIFCGYNLDLTHQWLMTLAGLLKITYNLNNAYVRYHYDHAAGTIWTIYTTDDLINEIKLTGGIGTVLTTGHLADAGYTPFGPAIDSRDGTLWMTHYVTPQPPKILHVERTPNGEGHYPLISELNINGVTSRANDIAFDSSDNSIWVTNSYTRTIYHIDPATGLELPGSLNLLALGFPDVANYFSVEYDRTNDNLWFGDNSLGAYHITKAGVLIALVPWPSVEQKATGFTLCPSSKVN